MPSSLGLSNALSSANTCLFSAAEVIHRYKAAAAWQLYLELSADSGDKGLANYTHSVAMSLGYDPVAPAQDDGPSITDANSTVSEQT